MKNPWLQLSETPEYVLPEDFETIKDFNGKVDINHRIWLEFLPVPYSGNVTNAEVIFLQLNPGAEIPPGLSTPNNEYGLIPELPKFERASLRQEVSAFPFVYLNPSLRMTSGFKYWSKTFSSFLKTEGDYGKLANKIACIEYFPYSSKNYKPQKNILESQKYGFYLLERAIARGAMIVMMRGERGWLEAVPSLKGKYIKLNQARNVSISERNMKGEDFEKIFRILK